MADEIDSANDRAQLDLDVALFNHMNRKRAFLPVCAECEENDVHIASNGCAWRVCMACACELGLVKPEAA